MLPDLRDILGILEEIAPADLAESWDNPGLQIGSYSQEIKKIFMALDPTLTALRTASLRNAQLLLTHHPLIFKPISRVDIDIYPGNVLLEAVKNSISVVAAHTNLDVAQGGINDILADLLNLNNVEVLMQKDEVVGAGLGRIGDLPGPDKLSAMGNRVKEIIGAAKIRIIGREDTQVKRLAVVGGSGGNLISLAYKKGADVLLTGDIGYHHAREAESLGMSLIDGGHFHTEKTAFRVFGEYLKAMIKTQGWEVGVEVDKDETDPFNDV